MKKRALLILVLAASLLLCACGKSEAAAATDEQIASIGEVTLESEAAIAAAEAAVDALEEKDRESLDNTKLLQTAREEYDRLVVEQRLAEIAAVENAISSIGKVDLNSGDAIAAARSAFDGCDGALRERVSNADVLAAAEETYAELMAAQAAEKVTEQINAIGEEVTLESEPAIREARSAYDALDDLAKGKVNTQALTAAENQLRELKEKERSAVIEKLLNKMKAEEDRFNQVTFYTHTTAPQYDDTRSYIIPYIGRTDSGYTYLCWYCDYTGDDWIFWDTMTFIIDGTKYTKSVGYNAVARDNAWGNVWEVYNTANVSDSDIQLFRSIAASEETEVRFSGKYVYDMTISAKDKQAIADVLALYDAWTEKI